MKVYFGLSNGYLLVSLVLSLYKSSTEVSAGITKEINVYFTY